MPAEMVKEIRIRIWPERLRLIPRSTAGQARQWHTAIGWAAAGIHIQAISMVALHTTKSLRLNRHFSLYWRTIDLM